MADLLMALRKLAPCGSEAPKFSATVWPMSASVERMPRFAPGRARAVREDGDVLARMICRSDSPDRDRSRDRR